MACIEHNWFFDSPCPKCEATLPLTVWEKICAVETAEITATVTNAVEPAPISPAAETKHDPVPPDADDPDPCALPNFLRRNPDNTMMYPGPLLGTEPAPARAEKIVAPPPRPPSALTDDELHAMLSANISVADRQVYFHEHARREKKRKTYDRLTAAGFTKA